VAKVEPSGGGERVTIEATVECDGVAKPVCAATLIILTVR
jgi:hypothetical protein